MSSLLTARELAAVLGLAPSWVRDLAGRGKIAHYRIGGVLRFDPALLSGRYLKTWRRVMNQADTEFQQELESAIEESATRSSLTEELRSVLGPLVKRLTALLRDAHATSQEMSACASMLRSARSLFELLDSRPSVAERCVTLGALYQALPEEWRPVFLGVCQEFVGEEVGE